MPAPDSHLDPRRPPLRLVAEGTLTERPRILALVSPGGALLGTPGNVLRCESLAELSLAARALQPARIVLALGTADEDDLSRPIIDTIRRLARHVPTASITTITAQPSIDLIAMLRSVGAAVVDARTGAPVDETPSTPCTVADWRRWMHDTYGLTVSRSTERVLALLATADDRANAADALVDEGIVARRAHAVRLLRSTTKALAGDEHRNTGAVARESLRALRGLAVAQPLRWRPTDDVPLSVAAAMLRRSPSLKSAAGLTAHEAGTLLALDEELGHARATVTPTVGAPPRGVALESRRWAAGRLAVQDGATADTVDTDVDAIISCAAGAARSVARAQAELLRRPQVRLACAIEALQEAGVPTAPDWLDLNGGRLTWQGLEPWQIAAHHPMLVPASLCRELSATIDALLVQHEAVTAALPCRRVDRPTA